MSEEPDLSMDAEITWCPGCHNFMILQGVKNALKDLIQSGLDQESIAISSGIGCHGKISNYLKLSSVHSLHGRVLPTCLGMKLGNPNLTVIGFGGDGDTYAEGTSHFIHTARYNLDMTMVVHNNQVFALTTGQGTSTSEKGLKTKSQPLGVASRPLNPLSTAIEAGATFVARVYANKLDHMTEVLKKAIQHDGFSLVDIAMPCLVYHEDTEFLDEKTYKLEDHDPTDKEKALEKAREWDYTPGEGKVPIGIFYREERKTLGEKFPQENNLMEEGKGWWQVER